MSVCGSMWQWGFWLRVSDRGWGLGVDWGAPLMFMERNGLMPLCWRLGPLRVRLLEPVPKLLGTLPRRG